MPMAYLLEYRLDTSMAARLRRGPFGSWAMGLAIAIPVMLVSLALLGGWRGWIDMHAEEAVIAGSNVLPAAVSAEHFV